MSTSSATSSLTRIQRAKTLPDDVYDSLLDMLLWGELEPDAPLSIDGLAGHLGVSPTPVREALARLEMTGLVRRMARRGYRVSPPMPQDVMGELVDARLVLESGALERAMNNVGSLLPDLEKAHRQHECSAAALSQATEDTAPQLLRQYFEDDWAFHASILQHCGNRYLTQAVDSLFFRVHRMRQSIGAGTTDAPIAVHEHQLILDAVRKQDRELALEMLGAHLGQLHERVETEGADTN